MRWTAPLFVVSLTASLGCSTPDRLPPDAVQVYPQGLTFWLTEQIPEVGTVVQLHEPAGTLRRGTIVSKYIADRVEPIKATGYDQSVTMSGERSLNATLKIFEGISPSFGASYARDKTLSFATEGSTVLAIASRQSFLETLRGMDGHPKESEDGRNLFALLNSVSASDGATSPAYYLVTAVYTAEKMRFQSGATASGGVSAKCDVATRTCGEISFSDEVVNDGAVSAKGAPVFVRLKRMVRNSNGTLSYLDASDGPPAITSN